MAAVRIHDGSNIEVWQDTVAFDGGSSVTIDTGIRIWNTTQLANVQCTLIADSISGNPTFAAIVKSNNNGYLRVVMQNTAAAGNWITYTVQIQLVHSVSR